MSAPDIVPLVVIGPPAVPQVVATEVTVPEPPPPPPPPPPFNAKMQELVCADCSVVVEDAVIAATVVALPAAMQALDPGPR